MSCHVISLTSMLLCLACFGPYIAYPRASFPVFPFLYHMSPSRLAITIYSSQLTTRHLTRHI